MAKILIAFINFYQRFLSFDRGLLMVFAPGGACKYPISCSEYTKERVREFGVFRGVGMGVRRFLSCR